MMDIPERALAVWFGRQPVNDIEYLTAWRDAPLTYSSGQDGLEYEAKPGFNVDHYEAILGKDESGTLFRRAADLVLRNRFYPPEVMSITADYDLEDRPVRAGDCVLQRITIFQAGERPLLEALTLNRITSVVETARQAGFTYVTTAAHSETGEWTPMVEWRDNNEVVLVINVISRTRQGMPAFLRRWVRGLQIRAHKLSIANFLSQLNEEEFVIPARFGATPATLIPFLVALIAGLITGITFLAIRRRNK
jgi:uncharacterized protein (UPF0548 family)